MRTIHTDIVHSPEWNAAAFQMAQAGFTSIAIQDAMFSEVQSEWERDFDESEIHRGIDAIRVIAERNIG